MQITLGQYIPGDSLVHRLDPRVKVFLMAMGIGVAFRVDSVLGLGAYGLFCVLITLLSNISLLRILRGLLPFIWLFLFTGILHIFMTPGDAIEGIPYATWQGLHSGLTVSSQLIFAIWFSTLTTLTTSPLDMVWAMEWYMRPLKLLKVPVDEIALLIMLAIRFIPILFEETDRIIKAQKARGVDIETGGVLSKVRSLVPVLVPLLHGVFRRADELAVALTLRGYEPGIVRTRMKTIRLQLGDVVALFAAAFILGGFVLL